MSLGILNNVSAIYAENNLNNTQASLQTVLQQLSSGARINSGADDAAGLAISNGLKSNEAALTQSAQNASDGEGLLSTADGALSQVTNLLDRAVTLATEAANGTLSTAQVSSANQEYQSILSEIGNIGSTTNFNGISVFSSNATSFYVGDGTATGANVFNDSVGALTVSNVGQSAPAAAAAITTVGLTGTGTTTALLTFAKPTDTVSGTFALTDATATQTISTTFAAGTSFAQAASQLQNIFGGFYTVTANAAAGTISLLNLAGDNVTYPGVSVSEFQGTAAVGVATAGTISTGAGTTSSSLLSVLRTPSTDTLTGTLNVALSGNVTASASITLNGQTLAGAVALINGTASFQSAGIVASIVGGNQLKLTGPAQVGTNTYTLTATPSNLVDAPAAATPSVGTNLSGSTITQSGASTLLTSINSAIANVSYQRGIIGADSNQLTAASNTAASENVNLTAAQSAILSTNYGEATSDLAKYEVLSQTGISALAQANSVQQEILKLLQ